MPGAAVSAQVPPVSAALHRDPPSLPQAWEAAHLTSMCWLAGNLMALVGSGGEVYVFQVSAWTG